LLSRLLFFVPLVVLANNNEFSAEMKALCEENTCAHLISHLRVSAATLRVMPKEKGTTR
jgi:hypothetical protein